MNRTSISQRWDAAVSRRRLLVAGAVGVGSVITSGFTLSPAVARSMEAHDRLQVTGVEAHDIMVPYEDWIA